MGDRTLKFCVGFEFKLMGFKNQYIGVNMIQASELWHQQKRGIWLTTQCEENDWDCEKLVLVVVHCVSAMLSLGRGGFCCWSQEEHVQVKPVLLTVKYNFCSKKHGKPDRMTILFYCVLLCSTCHMWKTWGCPAVTVYDR